MSNPKIYVGILEDDPEMRDYLEMVIAKDQDMEVAFSEGTLSGAQFKYKSGIKTDICLCDIQLPDGSGIDFVRAVESKSKSLVLTVLGDKTSVLMALEAGADGYLLKDSDGHVILKNIRKTMAGSNPISPEAATHLLGAFKQSGLGSLFRKNESDLNARETEILTCFAKGLSYKETASTLGLSPHTVNDHVKNIYAKLRVHSKSEAIFEALQMGWIEL